MLVTTFILTVFLTVLTDVSADDGGVIFPCSSRGDTVCKPHGDCVPDDRAPPLNFSCSCDEWWYTDPGTTMPCSFNKPSQLTATLLAFFTGYTGASLYYLHRPELGSIGYITGAACFAIIICICMCTSLCCPTHSSRESTYDNSSLMLNVSESSTEKKEMCAIRCIAPILICLCFTSLLALYVVSIVITFINCSRDSIPCKPM